MLKYYGFYEPDGFYHYSVIRAAVEHGFVIPKVLGISGWPVHAAVTEPNGLYMVTLVPYAILQYFGISYYTVMRLIPLLFAIFDIIGAYYLTRYLSKDRFFGLLVMLFVALSMGDAARTSALIYRGDGFVTIFLIIALIALIQIFKTDGRKRIYYMLASGIFLSICNYVWGGAPFATAVYIVAFVFLLGYGFIKDEKRFVDLSVYPLGSLLIWYLLVRLYMFAGFIQHQTFTGKYFLILYFFMALAWFVAKKAIENKERFAQLLSSTYARIATALAFAAIVGIMLDIAAPAFVYEIFVSNGFMRTSALAATIEELQPPTFSYFFASYGITLFATPMTIIMSLSSLHTSSLSGLSGMAYLFVDLMHHTPYWIFWIVMLFTLLPYFYMKIEDSGKGFSSGKAVWKLNATEEMLVLAAYFAVTAYLQLHAIRFNSLVAVPIAIFVAYTFYWLILRVGQYKGFYRSVGYGILVSFILYTLLLDNYYTASLTQADGMNPQFFSAISWLKNNSAPNAVVLTIWPDGSVVEGIANRTSIMDSVGAQDASKIYLFARWLLSPNDNASFLTSNQMGSPNYLLVRYEWMLETQGIFTEAGYNTTNTTLAQSYAFATLCSISEQVNSTAETFTLYNPPGSSCSPQGLYSRLVLTRVNSQTNVASYIITQNGISPFQYVAFVNQQTGNFSIVKQNFNITNGEMLAIVYSSIPRPGMPVNITGAYIFGSRLEQSNMIKFLYFCGENACLWNNKNASLQLVYANSDTKIFRILYNQSS